MVTQREEIDYIYKRTGITPLADILAMKKTAKFITDENGKKIPNPDYED